MSKLARVRKIPWLLVFEAVRLTQSHVMDATSPADRRRVMEILRASRGDPRRVPRRDRDELRRIVAKIDLKELAGGIGPSVMRHRGRR